MKTTTKIAAVVLIVIVSLFVFVLSRIKKKSTGKKQAGTTDTEQKKMSLVSPKKTLPQRIDKVLIPVQSAPSEASIDELMPSIKKAVPQQGKLLYITIEGNPKYGNFDYTMNYEGAIVTDSYDDAIPRDTNEQTLKLVEKNGAVFSVYALCSSVAELEERTVNNNYKAKADIISSRVLTKVEAQKKRGGSNLYDTGKMSMTDLPAYPKGKTIVLLIGKKEGGNLAVYMSKLVDLATGDVYSSLEGKTNQFQKDRELNGKIHIIDID